MALVEELQNNQISAIFKGIHPKYYKHLKKVLSKAIWADKKWAVSGRLACTSSKTEILNKIGI